MKTRLLITILIFIGYSASCSSPTVSQQWWDMQKGSFIADWPVPSLGIYTDRTITFEVRLEDQAPWMVDAPTPVPRVPRYF